MPVVHFESADSPERTRIEESIAEYARRADRLETGRAEDEYYVNHEDGCDVGGDRIEADEEFYFDAETGDVLCTDHGRARDEERAA